MKKLLLIILMTLTTSVMARDIDRFQGVWKHHYVQAEGITLRVSFKEAKSAPNIGQPKGSRFAYKLHIDAWGNMGFKSIDYNFVSMDERVGIEREYEGTLIKENYRHQYDRLTPGDEYFHLSGNVDFQHLLRVRIGDKTYQFFLDL